MNLYLIIYDTPKFIYTDSAIDNAIINLKGVTDWWNYLPSTFIVVTTATAKQLSDELLSRYPLLRFLVLKIELNEFNGVLQKDAWTWLEENTSILNRILRMTKVTTSEKQQEKKVLNKTLSDLLRG